MSETPQSRYTAVAITLHWLIAFGIIGMIGLGWYMGDLEDRAQQYALIQLHKSFGISILLLSVARLVWRLMNPPPPDPPMPAWQAAAARWTHIAFYVLIIGMPLTGWIMVSASPTGIPTKLFQTIPWPHIPGLADMSQGAKEAFHEPIEFVHSKLAWVIIALLALHVGAALKHQFLDKDHLLARMIPGIFGRTSGPQTPPRGGLIAFGTALAIFAVAVAGAFMANSAPQSNAAPEAEIALQTEEPVTTGQQTAQSAPTTPVSEPEIAPPAETDPVSSETEVAPPANPEPAPATPAPPPSWTVDQASSTLGFTAGYMGREFSGKFDDWTADITFDPESPGQGTAIRVEIALSSFNTGEPFYDENVVLGDWFDARNFPQAVFEADSAASLGDRRYRADGQLTIRDVTRPLALNFSLDLDGEVANVEAAATIQRLDFGIGSDTLTEPRGDEDWVANDVRITVDLRATRD